MLVQRSIPDLLYGKLCPFSQKQILHCIIRLILIIQCQICGKILRDHRMLNILINNFPVHFFSQCFIHLDQSGKILPSSGSGKNTSVHRILHPVKILSAKLQIRDDCRMDSLFISVFFPYFKVRLHINSLDSVESYHVKFTDRFIIFRRISRCHDHPSFRNFLVTKCLSLKELQHHRC